MDQQQNIGNNLPQGNDSRNYSLSEIIDVIEADKSQPASSLQSIQQQPYSPDSSSSGSSNAKPARYILLLEQPAAKAQRFRYKCEGRLAGSIVGINSSQEKKTFPTIEVVGGTGKVLIIVSCVTKDKPYRPHPHNLVGKDCRNGIYQVEQEGNRFKVVFSNLGIQCVKRTDIREELLIRKKLERDPFNTGYDHIDQPSSFDLNVVRLCFEAFDMTARKRFRPVVSEPIFDKKAFPDPTICSLCTYSTPCDGGTELILLCEKVDKTDIKVRFFDDKGWEAYAEFKYTDIHKQTAIKFKTPRYGKSEVPQEGATVYIQLVRPSDGMKSAAREFQYHNGPGMVTFPRIRRKLKRKQDIDIFQKILSMDSETTATKTNSYPPEYNDDNETVSTDSSASKPRSTDTLNEYDEVVKRESETEGYDEFAVIQEIEIEFEVPQIKYPAADDSTQTSTPMEEILKHPQLELPRQLSAADKITEWMRSSEFERTDSLTVENGDTTSLSPITVCTNVTSLSANNNHTTISTCTDDDKTFTDLMEQVAELDDMFIQESISRRGTLENPMIKELSLSGELPVAAADSNHLKDAYVGPSASANASVDVDETFDETATYTSLQIAFKNPIEIPANNNINNSQAQPKPHPPLPQQKAKVSTSSMIVNDDDGLVVLINPPAPKIKVNVAQTPPSPPSAPLPVPPRAPSPVGDQQKLPPLPPKRKTSHEQTSSGQPTPRSSVELSRNDSICSRPPSQIIIMRTPDQSPTKRQPTPTASPKKKPGFFSRLFSRRKSKADTNSSMADSDVNSKSGGSKATTPTGSRELSIGHFSLADPNRSSMRSVKSLQSNSIGLSPQNNMKGGSGGKPVGRSSSSVSGKRPVHLSADVIHIPLKGDSTSSLSRQETANAITFGYHLDRKTLSALHLADIPICDGNMELVAIADRQSIKNLCAGAYGVVLDPGVDLSECEHFALYTSIPPQNMGEANDNYTNNYGGQLQTDQILTAEDIARRLAEANEYFREKRRKTAGQRVASIASHLAQFEQLSNFDASSSSNTQHLKLPDIKTEPIVTPQFLSYRSPQNYQTATPSPQPLSPMMNRNALTPSPNAISPTANMNFLPHQTNTCFATNNNNNNSNTNIENIERRFVAPLAAAAAMPSANAFAIRNNHSNNLYTGQAQQLFNQNGNQAILQQQPTQALPKINNPLTTSGGSMIPLNSNTSPTNPNSLFNKLTAVDANQFNHQGSQQLQNNCTTNQVFNNDVTMLNPAHMAPNMLQNSSSPYIYGGVGAGVGAGGLSPSDVKNVTLAQNFTNMSMSPSPPSQQHNNMALSASCLQQQQQQHLYQQQSQVMLQNGFDNKITNNFSPQIQTNYATSNVEMNQLQQQQYQQQQHLQQQQPQQNIFSVNFDIAQLMDELGQLPEGQVNISSGELSNLISSIK